MNDTIVLVDTVTDCRLFWTSEASRLHHCYLSAQCRALFGLDASILVDGISKGAHRVVAHGIFSILPPPKTSAEKDRDGGSGKHLESKTMLHPVGPCPCVHLRSLRWWPGVAAPPAQCARAAG